MGTPTAVLHPLYEPVTSSKPTNQPFKYSIIDTDIPTNNAATRDCHCFCALSTLGLQNALRNTVKKSLQRLSKAINGDAKTEPQTLFKVL